MCCALLHDGQDNLVYCTFLDDDQDRCGCVALSRVIARTVVGVLRSPGRWPGQLLVKRLGINETTVTADERGAEL